MEPCGTPTWISCHPDLDVVLFLQTTVKSNFMDMIPSSNNDYKYSFFIEVYRGLRHIYFFKMKPDKHTSTA